MKIWVDITAPAHVLVFRPLIALMRERGDDVEVTARDYAQTVQLLEQHGIAAVYGPGASTQDIVKFIQENAGTRKA